MKNSCVVTLPIQPSDNPSLGLISYLSAASIYAKSIKLPLIVTTSAGGMRSPLSKKENVSLSERFLKRIRSFGVIFDASWVCDSVDMESFQQILDRLDQNSVLSCESVPVDMCPCGACEQITGLRGFSRKSILKKVDERIVCALCKGEVKSSDVVGVCLVEDRLMHKKVRLFPHLYADEVKKEWALLHKRKILVSRLRKGAPRLKVKKIEFGIDRDFLWQMFLVSLEKLGWTPRFLVTSNHTVSAALRSILVEEQATKTIGTDIVILPYFLGEGKQNLSKVPAVDTVTYQDVNALRLMVSFALRWDRKETSLQTSQLAHFRRFAKWILTQGYLQIPSDAISGILDGQAIWNSYLAARNGDRMAISHFRDIILSEEIK